MPKKGTQQHNIIVTSRLGGIRKVAVKGKCRRPKEALISIVRASFFRLIAEVGDGRAENGGEGEKV